MSEQATMSGHCLCGAVTITVENPVGWIGVCHCRTCQRWSGGVWAAFPADAATVTVTGPVRSHASSALADRAFCGTCGTHLWMRDRAPDAPYDLMPGPFDAARDWPLHSEVYSDEAFAAFHLKGDHRRATAEAYRDRHPEVREIP
jgi:hypothetical protein